MSTGATRPGNVDLILEIFAAVERRDAERFGQLVHADFEIHWPPALPYGGSYRDLDFHPEPGRRTWAETWDPLQPTAAERRMDPRVVATDDQSGEAVVLWRQRGRSPTGERFDGPVLGLYKIQDGRLARAQMFYFDTVALGDFLAKAAPRGTGT
ncbi:MAG TPA: nuclear transport factor 2 family protein [Actinomycetes bacterium]